MEDCSCYRAKETVVALAFALCLMTASAPRARSATSELDRLCSAIDKADLGTVRSMLGRNPGLAKGDSTHCQLVEPFYGTSHLTPGQSLAVVKLLVSKGADVNGTPYCRPLHRAVYVLPCAKFLVSKGADVNARDRNGWTPLHSAAYMASSPQAVEFLLSKGARLEDKENMHGFTALHLAASKNDRAMVGFLLRKGANKYARSSDGKTPADVAAQSSAELAAFIRGYRPHMPD